MNCVYINWNEASWFDPALSVAVKRAGCPVTVVSDRNENKHGAEWLDVSQFNGITDKLKSDIIKIHCGPNGGEFEADCFARWFVLRDLLDKGKLSCPLFLFDRDEIPTCNLSEGADPFLEFHCAATVNGPNHRAPQFINSANAVYDFCDCVESMLRNSSPRMKFNNDMTAWVSILISTGWSVGNLSNPINDSIFDNSLACGAESYQMDGEIKRIKWVDKNPYFITRDGTPHLARSLHCWGKFKSMIHGFSIKML